MAALLKPWLDDELVATMRVLVQAGYQLLPLGGGDDGKSPLRAFQGMALSLPQVMGPMGRRGSAIFGIRLPRLVVLDCDEDDPVLVARLEARFGPAAVHTRSPRGLHLWYAAPDAPLPNLKGEGLPVDVKFGLNAYVAGPGSVRPDGARYLSAKGDLARDLLTTLRVDQRTARLSPMSARGPAAERPSVLTSEEPRLGIVSGGKVPQGQRHPFLRGIALDAVRHVGGSQELMDHLRLVLHRDCEEPLTYSDGKLRDLADWAWGLRLQNSLWGSDNSSFRMSRQARAALKGKPYAMEAWWLLSMLIEAHGHNPAKPFVLNRDGMNLAGLDLSERAFPRARDLLVAEGYLHRVRGHRAGHSRAQWQLGRGNPTGRREPGEAEGGP